MWYSFTPAAERALVESARRAGRGDSDELRPPDLLLGLLAEPECRAAVMLAGVGVDAAAVQDRWPQLTPDRGPAQRTSGHLPTLSVELEASLLAAGERLAETSASLELATEHLLFGLLAADDETAAWLRRQGLDANALQAEIQRLYGHRPDPLPMESATQPNPATQNDHNEEIHILRVLDAAANRAGEGLRAVEDFVRFVLDDRHLAERCKQLRHDLAAAVGRIPHEHRLAARETQADVGTALDTPSEHRRDTPDDVLVANLTRLQESLRTLEEFGKLLDAEMAADIKQLRYQSYTLQRALEITRSSGKRLDGVQLYVLIDGRSSVEEFERLARSLIEAGVHVLQLRDKRLDDRELLQRARLLRELTGGSGTLFVVNDRPDLAALCHADGVHVGQEDLSVKDARTIVGPDKLVGVSTHSIEQARQAVADGANYIGVGPTFPSKTKQFDHFPGLDLLRAVSAEIRLPAFAIGAITPENLSEVLGTGVTRVAVSGAIVTAADPAAASDEILTALGH